MGLRVLMLTGDRPETAREVARAVGIDEVRARVRPDGKAAIVRELQAQGAKVVMAGDGINDAPALAQADLGIAMGAGADIAMAAGDVTLVRSDLRGVLTAVRLSRRTVRTVKENLALAFGYNILLIPLAAGVFFPVLGLQLDPMLAALAMALESLSVVGNSLRLRRFRRGRGTDRLSARSRRQLAGDFVRGALEPQHHSAASGRVSGHVDNGSPLPISWPGRCSWSRRFTLWRPAPWISRARRGSAARSLSRACSSRIAPGVKWSERLPSTKSRARALPSRG